MFFVDVDSKQHSKLQQKTLPLEALGVLTFLPSFPSIFNFPNIQMFEDNLAYMSCLCCVITDVSYLSSFAGQLISVVLDLSYQWRYCNQENTKMISRNIPNYIWFLYGFSTSTCRYISGTSTNVLLSTSG